MRKLFFFFSIWIAGCAITPQNERKLSVYDFGLHQTSSTSSSIESQQQQLPKNLLIAEAKSPVWLNSNAIQYRLAYRDPIQLYAYANSRWAAAPATLLTHHIRNSIAATNNKVLSTSDSVRADFILRLELEEFSQIFDTVDESHVIVKLRASLIERSSRILKAQHSFNIKLAAPTANAAGAVQALTESSDRLTGDLITWIAEEL